MKSVYVLMHDQKPNIEEIAATVAEKLHKAGIRVCAEPWLFERMQHAGMQVFDSCESSGCEAILSVGGDGTLLRANSLSMQLDLPLLGVNIGRVGFLAELEMDQLEKAFEKLAGDEYTIQERMMLKLSLGDQTAYALNDVVVSRGGYARLIGMDAYVDQDLVGHFIADGLIVSTPTGSTGYSLSAGGPIICPEVECMLLTPVCAHSLQHRPVVTSALQTVVIRLTETVQAMVSVDGQEIFTLHANQALTVTRASRPARFVRLEPRSFFSTIRIKLSEWSC
ncbi:MAG: NAD(+)/NADH kinase [Clostridia bacterium]|nr:NAD(+)/NADH kinase [Clostridia bacterium]